MALTDNLLAFYKLDNLTDSSGNERTLTNNGGVTFSSGKIGNAAEYDSSGWLYTNSLNLTNLQELTICFWVQHADVEGDTLNEVLGDWSAGSGPIFVGFGGITQYNETGYSTFGSVINTTEGSYTVIDNTARNSDWRFVVLRFGPQGFQLKTNNESWITTAVTGSPLLASSNGEFRVGDAGDSIPLASGDKLDAFGVWNRALSDAEIAELYNSGTGYEISAGSPTQSFIKLQDNVKFFGKVKFVS